MGRVLEGFVLVQKNPDKVVDLSGGLFHGWLFSRRPDGQFVSERKMEEWEMMQLDDQRDEGIVLDGGGVGVCPGEQQPLPAKMTAEQQAEAHWAYLKGVLNAHMVSTSQIELVGHHYRTAFVHGWKHGVEDLKG